MIGIINNKPHYNFNELYGTVNKDQIDSVNASTIIGQVDVQQGGTGEDSKGNDLLYNLGLSTNDNMSIHIPADFNSIQQAINTIPKMLNHTVTIYLAPGEYTENLTISGFFGQGMLRITTEIYDDNAAAYAAGAAILHGKIYCHNCACNLQLGAYYAPSADYPNPLFEIIGVSTGSTQYLVEAKNCGMISCNNMKFTGDQAANVAGSGHHTGIYSHDGSYIYVYKCAFYCLWAAVLAQYGGQIYLRDSVGSSVKTTAAVTTTNLQNKYAGLARYGGKVVFHPSTRIPGGATSTRPTATNNGHVIGQTTATTYVTTKFA